MYAASPDQIKKTVSSNVRRLLDEQQRSVYWLSQQTDEYESTLANIIHGVHVCHADRLARIANALGVSADDLLQSDEKLPSSA